MHFLQNSQHKKLSDEIMNKIKRITDQTMNLYDQKCAISYNLYAQILLEREKRMEARETKDMNDSFNLYVSTIPTRVNFSLLQDQFFGREIQKGNKDIELFVYKNNLKLVLAAAKKVSRKGVDFMELVSEGNIGLLNAVKNCDFNRK